MKQFHLLLMGCLFIVYETSGKPSDTWPWNRDNQLKRLPSSDTWRRRNVLALASNKSTCSGDFYFVVDSSASIGPSVFNQLKLYVRQLITMFAPIQVQYQDLNLGLVQFSSRAEVLSQLMPPKDTKLLQAIDKAVYKEAPYQYEHANIVRAFRLLTSESLWAPPATYSQLTKPKNDAIDFGKYDSMARRRKWKMRAMKHQMSDGLFTDNRRRLIVVFTDGQFGDSDIGMTMASLHVSRQTGSKIVFVGVNGEQSRVNIRNLMLLAEAPEYIYLLGSVFRNDKISMDALSSWNLASYICYSLQDESSPFPY